jgi:hypothetical protein
MCVQKKVDFMGFNRNTFKISLLKITLAVKKKSTLSENRENVSEIHQICEACVNVGKSVTWLRLG